MKGYTVFNVKQIDGLPEIYYAKAAPTLDPVTRIDRAERFFASMAATIKHGGNRAYYAQELDYVQMPPFEAFRDAERYYATLAQRSPSRIETLSQCGDSGSDHDLTVAHSSVGVQ